MPYPNEHSARYVRFEAAEVENDAVFALLERRFLAGTNAQLRALSETAETPRIAGHAAVYYDGTERTEYELWAGAVERIMPGAFDRAIREDDVRALFNHDANLVLGRTAAKTLSLVSDAVGLSYEIALPATQVGRDVLANIKAGNLTGSSFSFLVTDDNWRKEDRQEIREILAVQLFDVGPVTFPAYEATSAVSREARASHDRWLHGDKIGRSLAAILASYRALAVEVAEKI